MTISLYRVTQMESPCNAIYESCCISHLSAPPFQLSVWVMTAPLWLARACFIYATKTFSSRQHTDYLKFIYSEKATKFCEISPLLLTAVHTVKSKGPSQNIWTLPNLYFSTWMYRERYHVFFTSALEDYLEVQVSMYTVQGGHTY